MYCLLGSAPWKIKVSLNKLYNRAKIPGLNKQSNKNASRSQTQVMGRKKSSAFANSTLSWKTAFPMPPATTPTPFLSAKLPPPLLNSTCDLASQVLQTLTFVRTITPPMPLQPTQLHSETQAIAFCIRHHHTITHSSSTYLPSLSPFFLFRATISMSRTSWSHYQHLCYLHSNHHQHIDTATASWFRITTWQP